MRNVFRPGRSGAAATLGPLEAEIMDLVWERDGPVLVADVVRALDAKGRSLSHSAAKAVLNNLTGKRLLEKGRSGRATTFSAAVGRTEFEHDLVRTVVQSLRRSFGLPVLAHLVDEFAIDAESVAEFERLIREKREGRRGSS